MRNARTTLLSAVAGLAIIASGGLASAEPILDAGALKVLGGFYVIDSGRDFFTFIASDIDLRQDSGATPEKNFAASCTSCTAGDMVNLSFRNPDLDATGHTMFVDLGTGTATIGTQVIPTAAFSGALKFNAMPLLFPATDAAEVTLMTPFAFRGWLRVGQQPGPFMGGSEMRLGGSGTASARFVRDGGVYRWAGVTRYEFQPTPEPSTLLMLGAGLAGCVRTAAKRRRRN